MYPDTSWFLGVIALMKMITASLSWRTSCSLAASSCALRPLLGNVGRDVPVMSIHTSGSATCSSWDPRLSERARHVEASFFGVLLKVAACSATAFLCAVNSAWLMTFCLRNLQHTS